MLLCPAQFDVGSHPAGKHSRSIPYVPRLSVPVICDTLQQGENRRSNRCGNRLRADYLHDSRCRSTDERDAPDRIGRRQIRQPHGASWIDVLREHQHRTDSHRPRCRSIRSGLTQLTVQAVIPEASARTHQPLQFRPADGGSPPLLRKHCRPLSIAVSDVSNRPITLRMRMPCAEHLGCKAAIVTVLGRGGCLVALSTCRRGDNQEPAREDHGGR